MGNWERSPFRKKNVKEIISDLNLSCLLFFSLSRTQNVHACLPFIIHVLCAYYMD